MMKHDDDILHLKHGNRLPVDDVQGNLAHIKALISTGQADPNLPRDLTDVLERMVEEHAVVATVWQGRLTEVEKERLVTRLSKKGRRLWSSLRLCLKGRVQLGTIDTELADEDAEALYALAFAKSRNMSKGNMFNFWKLSDGVLGEIRSTFDDDQIRELGIRPVLSALIDNHHALGQALSITVGMPEPDADPTLQQTLLALRQTTRRYILRLRFLADIDPSQTQRVKHLLLPLQRWRGITLHDRRMKASQKKAAETKAAHPAAVRTEEEEVASSKEND